MFSPASKYAMIVLVGNHDSVPEAVNRCLMYAEFKKLKYEPLFSLSLHQCEWSCMRNGYHLDLAFAC